jgi:DNA-binding response OmpR family regulator
MSRILVIDDDPSVRRSLRKALELLGHEVDEAGTGLLGIAMHVSQRYDIIMTDLRMPDCDGKTVIANLRRFDRRVKIIMVTGDGFSDEINDAVKSESVWILAKPFNMLELEGVLLKALA